MPAVICEGLNLAFFSVPKAASTSMKLVLYELREGRPWTGEPDDIHKALPTPLTRPRDFVATEGMRRITIIRDPVKRLLSAYGNRVLHHGDVRNALRRPSTRLKQIFLRPWLRSYPSFDRFYGQLEQYQSLSFTIWHHTCSIRHFIGEDLSVFDRVYKVEELGQLEADLSEMAGREIRLPREQTGGMKLRLEDLSPKARAAVLEHTAPDYALLRGLYTPPA